MEKKSVKDQQLEIRIPAAGQWFIHASHVMLVNGKDMGDTLWGEIESELWKGKPGFSKERWAFLERENGENVCERPVER